MPKDDDTFDAVGAAAELDAALSGEAPSPAALEADLVALRAELADTQRALAAAEARADRAEAQVARAGERLAREAERELARRSKQVLGDMIAVLDDLHRALAADATDAAALRRGIEIVESGFRAALARHGVSAVAAEGEAFDPTLHEAVGVVPATEAVPDGRVAAVLRGGYRLGDELLRPAAVLVAKRS
jgi:molecular chaperone GrpE